MRSKWTTEEQQKQWLWVSLLAWKNSQSSLVANGRPSFTEGNCWKRKKLEFIPQAFTKLENLAETNITIYEPPFQLGKRTS